MAIVKAGAGSLRMDQLTFGAGGTVTSSTTNVHIAYSATDYIDFGGSYFFGGYSPAPEAPGQVSGTTTSVTDTVNGKVHYTVTGVDADARTLFGLISSGDITGAAAYVLRDDDTLTGSIRNDALLGFDGNDRINARAGNDILVGGEGRDVLSGGDGRDIFRYLAKDDSGTTAAARDVITDFSHADGDRIDLSRIDANEHTAANERFRFVTAFSGGAGEVMVKQVAGGYLVLADTDGLAGSDFSVMVKTDGPLVATDFIL